MQHLNKLLRKIRAPIFSIAFMQIFLGCLFFALLFSFVTILITDSYEWATKSLGLSEKNEVLTYLGLGMGGILAALQVVISNKRAQAMEASANAQVEATLNVARGNRQELFKNAIDHLGDKNVSVRLGAAHELLHIAEDDENMRETVLDILCSHIRNTTRYSEYQKIYSTRPSEEIQSLIKLITVRPIQRDQIFLGLRANLERSYLYGADFGMASLHEASFIETDLQEALFYKADLMGAKFFRTKMRKVSLCKASMQGAVIVDSDLQGADLNGAQLQGAVIGDVTMQGADIRGAQLQGIRSWRPDSNEHYYRFLKNIVNATNQKSDLSGITFGETVQQEDMDTFVRNKGATIGTYTIEDTGPWLSEFGMHLQYLAQKISRQQENDT